MYNPIEYSSNYFETTGSLWFYSKDEATDFNANIGSLLNSVGGVGSVGSVSSVSP